MAWLGFKALVQKAKHQIRFTLFDSDGGVRVSVADLARVNAGVFHRQVSYQQRMSLAVFTAHLEAAVAASSAGNAIIIASVFRLRTTVHHKPKPQLGAVLHE